MIILKIFSNKIQFREIHNLLINVTLLFNDLNVSATKKKKNYNIILVLSLPWLFLLLVFDSIFNLLKLCEFSHINIILLIFFKRNGSHELVS